MDCPLTVKMRAGVYNKNWNAHTLAPKLREWGVQLVTVSGDRVKYVSFWVIQFFITFQIVMSLHFVIFSHTLSSFLLVTLSFLPPSLSLSLSLRFMGDLVNSVTLSKLTGLHRAVCTSNRPTTMCLVGT